MTAITEHIIKICGVYDVLKEIITQIDSVAGEKFNIESDEKLAYYIKYGLDEHYKFRIFEIMNVKNHIVEYKNE